MECNQARILKRFSVFFFFFKHSFKAEQNTEHEMKTLQCLLVIMKTLVNVCILVTSKSSRKESKMNYLHQPYKSQSSSCYPQYIFEGYRHIHGNFRTERLNHSNEPRVISFLNVEPTRTAPRNFSIQSNPLEPWCLHADEISQKKTKILHLDFHPLFFFIATFRREDCKEVSQEA